MLNIVGKSTAIGAAARFRLFRSGKARKRRKASLSWAAPATANSVRSPPRRAPAKAVNVDSSTAAQLAFYQAQDSFGVFAPRGWKCFFSLWLGAAHR